MIGLNGYDPAPLSGHKPLPVTPLRVEPEPPDEPPRDPASEKRLLGALLIDNAAYHKVTGLLRAEHFAWTVHGRIYAAIGINALRPNSDRGRFIAAA